MKHDATNHSVKLTVVVSMISSSVIATITGASIYFSLVTRLSLMEQKQDTIIAQNQQMLDQFKEREITEDNRYTSLAGRVGNNSTRLTTLETLETVRHGQ